MSEYGHDDAMRDLVSIEECEESWECADGCCLNIVPRHGDECVRLAAYITDLRACHERLLAAAKRTARCTGGCGLCLDKCESPAIIRAAIEAEEGL